MIDLLLVVTIYLFVMLAVIATLVAGAFLVEAYKAVINYIEDRCL